MVEYSDLEMQNPWWAEPTILKSETDRLVKRARWLAVLQNRLQKNIVLVGPRRAGKTSLMKILMERLVSEGKNPKEILYLSCELIRDYKELKDYLEIFIEVNKGKTIFLDEIQYVEEWYRTIKFFIDKGINFFLTGSSSLLLSGEANAFLVDRYAQFDLLPMKFSELMEEKEGLKSRDLRIQFKNFPERTLEPRALMDTFENFSKTLIQKINVYFEKYLVEGGFPKTVFKGYSSEFYQQVLEEVFAKDLSKSINKSWRDFLRFLVYVSQSEGVAGSINSIAQGTELNHKTVTSWMEALEKLYIFRSIPRCERSKQKEVSLRRRKIYFQDRGMKTALYQKFSSRAANQRKGTDLSREAEAVIVENLLRSVDLDFCFFQESPQSTEIDILIRFEKSPILVDIEWGENYKMKKIEKKMKISGAKKAIILTRSEFHLVGDNIIKLPASLFSLLL